MFDLWVLLVLPKEPSRARVARWFRVGGGWKEPPAAVKPSRSRMRMRKRSTLTFPQLVLEVRVAPTFPVEIDAVTQEQGAAHARGDGSAPPAHHGGPLRLPSAQFLDVCSLFVRCSGGDSGLAQRLRAGRTRKDPAVLQTWRPTDCLSKKEDEAF